MQGWKRITLIATASVLIAAMIATWLLVDLGMADGAASVIGASAGVGGLVYALMGGSQATVVLKATQTGKAVSTGRGDANTGIRHQSATRGVQASAENTGDAEAAGADGSANTGVSTSRNPGSDL